MICLAAAPATTSKSQRTTSSTSCCNTASALKFQSKVFSVIEVRHRHRFVTSQVKSLTFNKSAIACTNPRPSEHVVREATKFKYLHDFIMIKTKQRKPSLCKFAIHFSRSTHQRVYRIFEQAHRHVSNHWRMCRFGWLWRLTGSSAVGAAALTTALHRHCGNTANVGLFRSMHRIKRFVQSNT